MSLQIVPDQSGNQYIEVGNIRVTMVEKQGWAAPEPRLYLRFQAYKGDPSVNKALNQGPELPIRDSADGFEFLAAISHLLAHRFRHVAPT